MTPLQHASRQLHFALLVFFTALHQTAATTEEKPPCSTCSMRDFEQHKQLRQQQILNDLLKKLELPAKPNVTVDYDNLPPIGRSNPRIKALIEQSLRENRRRVRKSSHFESMMPQADYFPALYETDVDVSPQISYVMAQRPPLWLDEGYDVAFFKFSSDLQRKAINKASLNAFLRRPEGLKHLETLAIRLDVYERFANGTMGDKVATKYEHVSGTLSESMVNIPLDDMDVQRWLYNRAGTEEYPMGLYVEAMHEGENLAYHPISNFREPMYLELEIIGSSGRSKRSAPKVCEAGSNETKCCLYDLVIDFEKVGWEFVIAPKRYNAYICNGACSAAQISATPRGSFAQQAQVDFFPCCHPKEYTGITIVYETENNQIWVKEVPGMVARKCGCA